jgi:predicted nucleotidyltransferase
MDIPVNCTREEKPNKRSPMPRPSRNSAGVTYLQKERRISDLRDAARRARERQPSIQKMILFGSLAAGIPTPRSDADILVVVEASQQRGRDRLPDILSAMSPLPCPVDLHVVTVDELANARERGDPLLREAMKNGFDLLA